MKIKPLLFISLLISSVVFAQIQRVEPAFWWHGMKNTELQILLYGENLSKYNVELSDNVPIKDLQKVENPNYLFLTINTNEVKNSNFKIYLKKGKKTLSTYQYELKQRETNSANRASFSSKDAIYLIMPDRFSNGDETNDSQPDLIEKADRKNPGGRHGGDLRGIINQLDYLQNLGITALWLTPVNQDNEKNYSYHGYAQTDLYKIDGRYGTNEEYKELSDELKKRGMLLIQDYVTNHWGISHWLIQDLPMQDWIHQFPDGEGKYGFKRSNYRTTAQFDINASEIDKKEALNGWFDTTMPDLNQNNPFVLKYLTQNAIWWIEYAGLGGLRVDTYPYNNKEAMAKWAKSITDEYPNLNIVGEAWVYNSAHIAFWQKNSKIAEIVGYNSHLPSVMDFTLYTDLPSALKEKEGWDSGLMKIYNALGNDFLYPDINNVMVFFENHDTERWNEVFNSDFRYYQMAISLIATIRGYPQIYYGSEIGMRGNKNKGGDADIRQDFPGGWKSDAQNAFKNRTPEQNQYHDYTAKLLNWRKNKKAIHTGKTTHYMPKDNVLVYFRYLDNEKIMVILNNNEEEYTLNLQRFKESLNGASQGFDPINEKKYPISFNEELKIPAKSVLILEVK